MSINKKISLKHKILIIDNTPLLNISLPFNLNNFIYKIYGTDGFHVNGFCRISNEESKRNHYLTVNIPDIQNVFIQFLLKKNNSDEEIVLFDYFDLIDLYKKEKEKESFLNQNHENNIQMKISMKNNEIDENNENNENDEIKVIKLESNTIYPMNNISIHKMNSSDNLQETNIKEIFLTSSNNNDI